MSSLLFVYGTLAPRDGKAAGPLGFEPDAVRGRLYDLGPYPALVDLGDPTSGWVEGFVRPVSERWLQNVLDRYEGVDENLYRRVFAVTRKGRNVWVYEYARPVPATAVGPLSRWGGRVRVALDDLDALESGGS
jgi:gamma-glutamylcyclotransferase (GGCT)/AIG2-like uncharacterized protein YtfP